MRTKYLHTLVFCLAILAFQTSCEAKKNTTANPVDTVVTTNDFKPISTDSLPALSGYVNDFENIYTEQEEKNLDSLIRGFEKNTFIQIALITIDTTMTSKENLDSFTLKTLIKWWGISEKNTGNRIIIGISKGYRKMRIQNDYGVQKILTDSKTQEIIENVFIPEFKKENYFEGTSAGIKALLNTLQKSGIKIH